MEWRGTDAHTTRGYEDTTTTTIKTTSSIWIAHPQCDQAPCASCRRSHLWSVLQRPARRLPTPFRALASHLEISCMQNLQRHDSIPAPAGETPDVMRVLSAEGSRGAGGAGRGFYSLIWPV
ncbi:hypothetical protein VE01_10747 [Pseudogymnoascus verrucosus]|uniref:Uncharacterized protein n=1 Tax=Pseudogymnoascus verrucosus TaxID=342668 RepID=A0A2P6FGS9_9PEZI|nr:uncharacterized protein VE01_10747 [Pseudogymnoascus verrucosus]PQM43851.1 hypothetical protein VE01_10747 [Pseudogymnoascus verrucosus]